MSDGPLDGVECDDEDESQADCGTYGVHSGCHGYITWLLYG